MQNTNTIVVAFQVKGHGTKTFAGTTTEDVNRQWSRFRDANSVGASEVTGGECTVNGLWLGRMSYNGKIWPEKDWKPGDAPIYDPYDTGKPAVTHTGRMILVDLELIKTVLGCSQAAPWLVRLPFGDSNALRALQATVAEAEG